jgi:hypothetical protein
MERDVTAGHDHLGDRERMTARSAEAVCEGIETPADSHELASLDGPMHQVVATLVRSIHEPFDLRVRDQPFSQTGIDNPGC